VKDNVWTPAEERRLANMYRQAVAASPPGKRIFLQDIAKLVQVEFPDKSVNGVETKIQRMGLWKPIYRKQKGKAAEAMANGAQAKIVTIRCYRCPHCGKLSEVKK
jgi:hypothetical protein